MKLGSPFINIRGDLASSLLESQPFIQKISTLTTTYTTHTEVYD